LLDVLLAEWLVQRARVHPLNHGCVLFLIPLAIAETDS
jgi:hypothetical protein